MATNRARRSRRWTPDLDGFKRMELLCGPGASLLVGCGYLPQHSANHLDDASAEEWGVMLAEMEADWKRHGDDLLAEWTHAAAAPEPPRFASGELGGPGTRPWAWWQFDAPEDLPEGETEPDYLDRLGLWRPGERAKLPEGRQ